MPNRNKRSPLKSPRTSQSRGAKATNARTNSSRLIDPSAIAWAVSFIDRFEKPEEKFATPRGLEKQPDGSLTFPWIQYSPDVTEFEKGLYERHLNVVFDWGKWKRGEKLIANPGLIDHANAADCLKLITLCVRQERTYGGFLAEALESGVITACLKRLRALYS